MLLPTMQPHLLLLKVCAGAQHASVQVVDCGLDLGPCCLSDSVQVFLGDLWTNCCVRGDKETAQAGSTFASLKVRTGTSCKPNNVPSPLQIRSTVHQVLDSASGWATTGLWSAHSRQAFGTAQIALASRTDPACTEDVPVCEILCRQVADGQPRQHHLGAGLHNLFQLAVDDVPLSIYNGLVLGRV